MIISRQETSLGESSNPKHHVVSICISVYIATVGQFCNSNNFMHKIVQYIASYISKMYFVNPVICMLKYYCIVIVYLCTCFMYKS